MDVHSCEHYSYKSELLFGMIYHVRRHSSNSQVNLFSCDKPLELYSCPHCYFENDLSIVLKKHAIDLHKNEENEGVEDFACSTYDCEKCKFQTFSVLVMLRHVTDGCAETKTSISRRKRFECDQCAFETSYKRSLNNHKICKHTNPEDIKWLECDRCELKFKTSDILQRHVQNMHEIKWLQCSHCSYKAAKKGNLQSHVYRKHCDSSEIKWFECDRCSYKGKCKSDLKNHVKRVHLGLATKEAKFACDQCSYVTKRNDSLSLHKFNKHTSSAEMIKLHKCDQCPYATNFKSNLRKHKIYKHTNPEDIKWLECDSCEEKFKTADLLRQHVKKVHECVQCPDRTVDNSHGCPYRSKFKNVEDHLNQKLLRDASDFVTNVPTSSS